VKQATLPCRNRYRRLADTSGHTAKTFCRRGGSRSVHRFSDTPEVGPMSVDRLSAQAATVPERYGKTRKISGR
jgi:hypothetical protein